MIKKGLKVRVLTGKDKKKEGEVIEIDRSNNRAKVKDINMVKRHVKTTKEKKGGIFSKESFIHLSNLKLINEKTKTKKTEAKKIMTPRLKELYYKEIQPALKSQFGFKNLYMGPKIEKIVLNMGLGLDGNDSKILKSCEEDLAKITGQKPVITKFKKSVANFKTRKGSNAGLKVTLRKDKMYEFLDRLVNIALPRIKDFRGLSANGFDKFGNYTFGVKEHIIFPEVSFDRADKVRGIDIVIVISAKSKEHSFALLEKLNFPFIKKGDN